jgi:hypothetical protein
MATRDGGSHPFNWFLIGFVVGVAATLAALLFLGARHDRSAPEDTDAPAGPAPAAAIRAAPPTVTYAPPVAAKKVAPATDDRPHVTQRESDAQMAEDAAAAGMTSRTTPGQSPDQQQ